MQSTSIWHELHKEKIENSDICIGTLHSVFPFIEPSKWCITDKRTWKWTDHDDAWSRIEIGQEDKEVQENEEDQENNKDQENEQLKTLNDWISRTWKSIQS